MAVAKRSSITHLNRMKGLLAALDKSTDAMQAFANKTVDKWESFADSLVQMAQGVWYEQEYTDQTGKKKRKIYQKLPNVEAINAIVNIGGPEKQAAVLLAYMRAMQAAQDIDAGIAKAKTRNLDSQTLLNTENAAVFHKMIISQEDYEAGMQGIGGFAIQQMQQMPREMMLQICSSDESYQEWTRKFVQRMLDHSQGVIKAETERLLIEGGTDEDEDDGED